jgi:hypothetical protein
VTFDTSQPERSWLKAAAFLNKKSNLVTADTSQFVMPAQDDPSPVPHPPLSELQYENVKPYRVKEPVSLHAPIHDTSAPKRPLREVYVCAPTDESKVNANNTRIYIKKNNLIYSGHRPHENQPRAGGSGDGGVARANAARKRRFSTINAAHSSYARSRSQHANVYARRSQPKYSNI